MTTWLTTSAGQPVKCPHCGYRLKDSGPETIGRVRKSEPQEPIPAGASVVHCKGCRKFYQEWPQASSVAA